MFLTGNMLHLCPKYSILYKMNSFECPLHSCIRKLPNQTAVSKTAARRSINTVNQYHKRQLSTTATKCCYYTTAIGARTPPLHDWYSATTYSPAHQAQTTYSNGSNSFLPIKSRLKTAKPVTLSWSIDPHTRAVSTLSRCGQLYPPSRVIMNCLTRPLTSCNLSVPLSSVTNTVSHRTIYTYNAFDKQMLKVQHSYFGIYQNSSHNTAEEGSSENTKASQINKTNTSITATTRNTTELFSDSDIDSFLEENINEDVDGSISGSVGAAVLEWSAELESAGVPEAALSVQYIAAHVLNTNRAGVAALSGELLTAPQVEHMERLLTCRMQRMPLQYVLGEWDFHGITLALWPPVFIPRSETEMLVNLALDLLPSTTSGGGAGCRLLELCCGSGAVSLAVLHHNQQAEVCAVDQSGRAIELAAHNATRLGCVNRLRLLHHKISASVALPLPHSSYDVIVANPPYVFTKDLNKLQPEIFVYEDVRALDGGVDGLDVIKLILAQSAAWLTPAGHLLMEVDPRHSSLVPAWLATEEGQRCEMQIRAVEKDVHGRDRVLHLVTSRDTSPGVKPHLT